jgi:hypothetical protein
MADFKPKKPGKRRSNLTVRLVEVVIALIIIYAIASWAIGATSVTYINSPANVTFTNATSLFMISGNEYAVSVISSTSSSAQIYVTKVPAFQNPTFAVTMYLDNTTNFNGTAGRYANMQLKLLSTGSKSAVVEVTPIPGTIVLNPTASRITVVGSTLTPVAVGGEVSVTTVPTTSVPSATTSVSTTATTTIGGQAGSLLKAQSILASSEYFSLMNNYTILYKETVNCTPGVYNLTFEAHNHFAPSGPSAYSNVSLVTPYSVVLNVTNSSNNNVYLATYKTLSRSTLTTGTALVVKINVTVGQIANVTYAGAFYGQNYADLASSYTSAKELGACGVLIV